MRISRARAIYFSLESFYLLYRSLLYLSFFRALYINFTDSINDSNPRVIKDVRPRKLACDLRCPYYETCAIYGLNVERVFQDGKTIFIEYIYLWKRLDKR